jgi:glycosyltransferase involved in cell wall biosynthesis
VSKLRYLLVATHVPASGSGGGIVRYTVELATALADRRDVELHLLVTRPGMGYFKDALAAATCHEVPNFGTAARSLIERSGIIPGLRGKTFDVVHGTKHLVPRRSPATVKLLTVHDMLLFDRKMDFPFVKRTMLGGPYLASIGDADVVVCVSDATRVRLVEQVPSASAKSIVVPLAASSVLARATPIPVPELADTRFALVVGDASPRKNLALVSGIWHGVRESVPGAVLAVVGPNDWGPTLHGDDWTEHVAAGGIQSLGQVSDGVLRWCYENAAVLLCPSVAEGFGLPVVEASRFGTPVITSMDPALCEASGPADIAVSVSDEVAWRDAVIRAFETPLARVAPSEATRTWNDVADETVRAARDFIDQSRR